MSLRLVLATWAAVLGGLVLAPAVGSGPIEDSSPPAFLLAEAPVEKPEAERAVSKEKIRIGEVAEFEITRMGMCAAPPPPTRGCAEPCKPCVLYFCYKLIWTPVSIQWPRYGCPRPKPFEPIKVCQRNQFGNCPSECDVCF